MTNLKVVARNLSSDGKLQRHACVPVWVRALTTRDGLTTWQINSALPILPAGLAAIPEKLWTSVRTASSSFLLSELAKGGEELLSLTHLSRQYTGIFDGIRLTPTFITEAAAKASLR